MTGATALVGRSALVTGASRGIGRAAAVRLREGGVDVRGLARDAEALAELERLHGVVPLVVDLADDAEVWSAMDAMVEAAGPPDIVVNAAGAFDIVPLASETVRGFDTQIAINLRAPFLVIRALMPAMLERGSGLFVNVGSVAGRKAFPGNGAYSASKYGLRGLHDVLVEELRGTGLRAALIEPSSTDTELWDPLDPDADPGLPDRADMLLPEDVADLVWFAATRPEGISVPLLRVERG